MKTVKQSVCKVRVNGLVLNLKTFLDRFHQTLELTPERCVVCCCVFVCERFHKSSTGSSALPPAPTFHETLKPKPTHDEKSCRTALGYKLRPAAETCLDRMGRNFAGSERDNIVCIKRDGRTGIAAENKGAKTVACTCDRVILELHNPQTHKPVWLVRRHYFIRDNKDLDILQKLRKSYRLQGLTLGPWWLDFWWHDYVLASLLAFILNTCCRSFLSSSLEQLMKHFMSTLIVKLLKIDRL